MNPAAPVMKMVCKKYCPLNFHFGSVRSGLRIARAGYFQMPCASSSGELGGRGSSAGVSAKA
jgi:hypothetical protein